MVFGPLPWRDPLLCVKTVHPEFTTEDLRKLSEAPWADGAGVYPATVGTGKEVFESISIWNPQCKDYSFEELRFVHSYLCNPASLDNLSQAPSPFTVVPKSHISPPEKLASNALLSPARTSFLDTTAPPKGLTGQPTPRGFMRG